MLSEVDQNGMRWRPDMADAGYRVYGSGGSSDVYVYEDRAVKLPREQTVWRARSLLFQALVTCHLTEAQPASPLYIPGVIECDDVGPPYFLTIDKVPGKVLDIHEVRALAPAEQQVLGTAIGRFAAWMGGAISPEAYGEIKNETAVTVYDRILHLSAYARMQPVLKAAGCRALCGAADEVAEELLDRWFSLVRPQRVGHDDLRPDNIGFEQVDGLWRPTSVFDFELTKPMTPEREFRHIRAIGKLAADAAAESYEAATGTAVSSDDVELWAKYQSLGTVIGGAVLSRKQPTVDRTRPALEDLFPDEDWSELDGVVARL